MHVSNNAVTKYAFSFKVNMIEENVTTIFNKKKSMLREELEA